MPDRYPQPVFLDATVISNYASTNSVEFLVRVLETPLVVPAVRDEIEQRVNLGHEYLARAVEAFDEGLPVSSVPPEIGSVSPYERLDTGETEALRGAAERDGTLATDDLAARRLATELDVPVTGSIGLLVLGIKREHIDSATADEWLDIWRTKRATTPLWKASPNYWTNRAAN
jgi:predicted nucleic acid-binding protein